MSVLQVIYQIEPHYEQRHIDKNIGILNVIAAITKEKLCFSMLLYGSKSEVKDNLAMSSFIYYFF